ncbi:MAG: hypothetical protein GVY29_12360, partial [Spirochaetes bacterium]|nr:hypothetical protein [Spirochaetota bacterium]
MPGSAHAALRLIRGGIALALLLTTTIGFVSAQELETTTPSSTGRTGSVELSVIPVASVPLGASSELYTAGVGGCLGGHLRLASLDWLVPTVDM